MAQNQQTGQNVNLIPPEPGLGVNPITVAGRTYTGVVGTALAVPDFDADHLTANGWLNVGYTGTTAQRPAYGVEDKGKTYYDTTLSKVLTWTGKFWRNAAGASV